MQTNWFYAARGKQKGPVNDDAFFALIREGIITADMLVWRKAMSQWLPLTEAVRGDEEYESRVQESLEAALSLAAAATVQDAVQVTATQPDADGKHAIPCSMCGRPGPVVDANFPEGGSWLCPDCQRNALQGLKNVLTQQQQRPALAGFFPRIMAYILDMFILNILFGLFVQALGWTVPEPMTYQMILKASPEQLQAYVSSTMSLFALLIGMLLAYRTLLIGTWGATMGMWMTGLRAIHPGSGAVGYPRAFARAFGMLISEFFLGIGYFIALFDSERRTLQDHLAGTRVIRIPFGLPPKQE